MFDVGEAVTLSGPGIDGIKAKVIKKESWFEGETIYRIKEDASGVERNMESGSIKKLVR